MKKVIFDVDGVLLSEKRYFDVSALVVWECETRDPQRLAALAARIREKGRT